MFFKIVLGIFLSFLSSNLTGSFYNVSKVSGEARIEKAAAYIKPFKVTNAEAPELPCEHIAVYDIISRSFIYEKQATIISPLASISKLMTALVFLDNNPGWEKTYKITRDDLRSGGQTYLYLGDEVKNRDLFYDMLVGSDNTAAAALSSASGLSRENFVKAMNAKARALGLTKTQFGDETGLDNNNVSTAQESALLVLSALNRSEISAAVNTKKFIIITQAGDKRKVENTDSLLKNFSDPRFQLLGGKTGYTESAGYCLASRFADNSRHPVAVAVLNCQAETDRFSASSEIIRFIYNNYRWP